MNARQGNRWNEGSSRPSGGAVYGETLAVALVRPHRRSDSLIENLDGIRAELLQTEGEAALDLVVLPELVDSTRNCPGYADAIRSMAVDLGCAVVGGTRYIALESGKLFNEGIVTVQDGSVAATYRKRFPYGTGWEDVEHGDESPTFFLGPWRVGVAVCADLWRSEVCSSLTDCDLVTVPCFSISRRASPQVPRSLWHQLATVRSFELGAFVGVSDWAHPSPYYGRRASGASAMAVPFGESLEELVTPLNGEVAVFRLDRSALSDFKQSRALDGFGSPSGRQAVRSPEA